MAKGDGFAEDLVSVTNIQVISLCESNGLERRKKKIINLPTHSASNPAHTSMPVQC